MPVLEVNGRRVEVDDSFLSLSPQDQEKTVDEIAGSLGQTQNMPERATEAPGQAEAQPGVSPPRGGLSPAGEAPGGSPESDRSTFDVLTGADGGERYQTWPERAVRSIFEEGKSAATLPGDVYAGKVDPRSPEGMRRATGAAMLATPVNPAVRAGAKAIPGVAKNLQKAKTEVPTREELKAIGKIQLDEFKDSGLELPAKDIQNWSQGVMHELHQQGMGGQVAKKANKILKSLQKPPEGGFTTAADLHALRRTLGNVTGDATEVAAANMVRQRLDDFIERLGEEGSMAGPVTALKKGRANYAASKRSERLSRAEEEALDAASTSGSGANVDNATRQAIKRLRKQDSKGFTPEEVAEMKRVQKGSRAANTARFTGNVLGGGGGLGSSVSGGIGGTLGYTLMGPVGAVAGGVGAPALGSGLKRLGGTLTRRGLHKLDESTRQRSPLYEERAAAAPMEAGPTMGAGNTVRALLMSGMLAPQGLPMVDRAQAGPAQPLPQEQQTPTIDVPAPKPVAETLQRVAALYQAASPEDQAKLKETVVRSVVKGAMTRQGEARHEYIRDAFSPESMQILAQIFGPEMAEKFKEQILMITLRPVG